MDEQAIDNLTERLTGVVRAILAENSIERPFGPDDRLVDIGLTSLDMVTLMLRVEAECDISIPQADITPENFRSVTTVEMLVRRVRGTGGIKP